MRSFIEAAVGALLLAMTGATAGMMVTLVILLNVRTANVAYDLWVPTPVRAYTPGPKLTCEHLQHCP